jgi:uncharacterized protein (TIGR00255 family)
LPRNYSFLEEKIKPHLQSNGISRGKVDVSITIENIGTSDVAITLNEEYAKAYYEALKQLRDTLALPGEITVATLQRDQNIFNITKVDADEEQDFADLCVVLNKAIEKFILAREREGANIESDLRAKVDAIKERVNLVEEHSQEDISSYRSRLEEKLRTVLSDNKITLDENRILTECAIFADKVAVDEELVRLRSHFVAF